MPQYYSNAERGEMLKLYQRSGSYSEARKQYGLAHGIPAAQRPPRSTIQRIVSKFNTNYTLHNLNKDRSGRKKTTRSVANIDVVKESVATSPVKSIRKRSQVVDINCSGTWRILKKDLQLKPYKMQVVQSLKPDDFLSRMQMCEKFNHKIHNDEHFLNNVWFSDEAHFYLDGMVHQNMRYWTSAKPQNFIKEKKVQAQYVTVWVAISAHGIIGPYFSEDEQGNRITIKQDNYREIVQRFAHDLQNRGFNMAETWFQQDGAPPHTAYLTIDLLKNIFGDRLISSRCEFNWAPRSPDLSPLDYFVWGYAKTNVFKNNPHTIGELKVEIENFISSIPQDMCQRAINNMRRRINLCIERQGHHFG
jgi:hypothetical protein